MFKKFIRILVVVMLDMVILLLIEVQTNDMAFTFFHTSSLPILLPRPFKLDKVQGPFSVCFGKTIEESKKINDYFEHQFCVFEGFYNCMWEMHPHDPLLKTVDSIESVCLSKHLEYIKKRTITKP